MKYDNSDLSHVSNKNLKTEPKFKANSIFGVQKIHEQSRDLLEMSVN